MEVWKSQNAFFRVRDPTSLRSRFSTNFPVTPLTIFRSLNSAGNIVNDLAGRRWASQGGCSGRQRETAPVARFPSALGVRFRVY